MERLYGLNPANAADLSSDADADGQTAPVEFHSRTSAADPKSLLRIEKFTAFPYPGSEHSVQ